VVSLDPDLAGAIWTAREVAEHIANEYGFSIAVSTARALLNRLWADRRARRIKQNNIYYYEIVRDFTRGVRLRFPQQFTRVLRICLLRRITYIETYLDLVKNGFSELQEITTRLGISYQDLKPSLVELKNRGWVNNWTATPPERVRLEPIQENIRDVEAELGQIGEGEERERLLEELADFYEQEFDILLDKYWYPTDWVRWEYILENQWYQDDRSRNGKYELRGEFETPLELVTDDNLPQIKADIDRIGDAGERQRLEDIVSQFENIDRVQIWEQAKQRAEEMLLEWINDYWALKGASTYEDLMDITGATQTRSIRGLEHIAIIFLDENAELNFNSLFQLFFEFKGNQYNKRENQDIPRRWYWE